MYGTMAPGVQASVAPSSSGQYVTSSAPPPQQMRVAAPQAAARRPKPKPKPKKKKGGVPGINQYLAGDTTYNDQASQLQNQLEQFNTQNVSQQGMVNQDFTTALDKMMKQKGVDESNMQGDFGSRGLLNSGLFTKSLGDYENNWAGSKADLETGKQRSLTDLLNTLSNYQTENRSSLLAAKQEAIRRRAQQYGITV